MIHVIVCFSPHYIDKIIWLRLCNLFQSNKERYFNLMHDFQSKLFRRPKQLSGIREDLAKRSKTASKVVSLDLSIQTPFSSSLIVSELLIVVEVLHTALIQIMAGGKMFKTKSRRLAFLLLLLFGGFVILLGLLVLSVGLAISHHDDFHNTKGLEAKVKPEIDYVQYWIGLPVRKTSCSINGRFILGDNIDTLSGTNLYIVVLTDGIVAARDVARS